MANKTNQDKKEADRQRAAYAAAGWARVIKCTSRGGGSARMVKRGS